MLRITTYLSLLAFGCAAEENLATTEQGIFHDIQPPGDECEPWGCGSNSPVMLTYRFWDLPEPPPYPTTSTLTNLQGFRITGFTKGGWNYNLDVVDDQLIGHRTVWPYTTIAGTDLVGASIFIDNDETNEKFQIYVAEVGRVPLFVHPNGRTIVTRTYRLRWMQLNSSMTWFEDLCGASTEPDGVTPFHAVLFDDDWIDTAAIRVNGARRNWFNIGCKGHAIAKQHLLGHTNAAATLIGNGWNTPYTARTANLKMLTGDYCGTGNPMTVAGEPLLWRDANTGYNTLGLMGPNAQIEARWRASGAICLNTPRVDFHHPYPSTVPEFPNGIGEWMVAPWCPNGPPPPCTGWMASLSDMTSTDILTVVQ